MDPITIGQALAAQAGAGGTPAGSMFGGGGAGGLGGLFANASNNLGQGLNGIYSGLFLDQSKPYREASKTYEDMFNQGLEYLNPFWGQGINAGTRLVRQLDKMQNPSGFLNSLIDQYQQSPYLNFLQKQGQRAATNAASGLGLIGSTPYQQAGIDYANEIAQRGLDNWLSQALGINNQYLSGQNNLYSGGLNAAGNIGQMYGQGAQDQARLKYGEEAGENYNKGSIFGGVMKLFGL